jgi:hypothetical protein
LALTAVRENSIFAVSHTASRIAHDRVTRTSSVLVVRCRQWLMRLHDDHDSAATALVEHLVFEDPGNVIDRDVYPGTSSRIK